MFGEKSYDALDLNDTEFMEDYAAFEGSIADLDKRLASIICQAFDDCSGLESAFRVRDLKLSKGNFCTVNTYIFSRLSITFT